MTNPTAPTALAPAGATPCRDDAHGGRRLAFVAAISFALGVGATSAAFKKLGGASEAASSDPVTVSGSMKTASTTDKPVFISPARQQLIGVRTATVVRSAPEATLRVVGTLAYDETKVAEIHPKVSGWVEHVSVDYVGKPVKRGQALFSLYSPELVTTQNDYLIAKRTIAASGGGASPETRAASEALLGAIRDRFRRWDVGDAEIRRLDKTGTVTKTITVSSPFDGVVVERRTFPGQFVGPDTATFKIADLSKIWAFGEVFESDAARIRVGNEVDVTFPNQEGATAAHGTIAFVYPSVDPQTRRVKFRVELRNAKQALKPETFVTLVVHTEIGPEQLSVPKEAVIDTGARQYVLIALADGYFQPRTVEIGASFGEHTAIKSGVAEGDLVVTSAQFLIDSETNLAAAMAGMSLSMPGMDMSNGGEDKPPPPPGSMPAGPPPGGGHPAKPGMAPGMPGMAPGMPGMDMPAVPQGTPPVPAPHNHTGM